MYTHIHTHTEQVQKEENYIRLTENLLMGHFGCGRLALNAQL